MAGIELNAPKNQSKSHHRAAPVFQQSNFGKSSQIVERFKSFKITPNGIYLYPLKWYVYIYTPYLNPLKWSLNGFAQLTTPNLVWIIPMKSHGFIKFTLHIIPMYDPVDQSSSMAT